MPDSQEIIYAKDFINILEKMHASKTYKSMVIYIEACEAGSIFDGLLPKNLSIYATTASNSEESSFACYCGVSKEYENVCLGDLYSVAWMEDREKSNPTEETLQEQYLRVKKRTGNVSEPDGYSHVMQYGDLSLSQAKLASYTGANYSRGRDVPQLAPLAAVEQREADLFYLKKKVQIAPLGSNERIVAQKELDEEISQRKHVDQSVAAIGGLLFGQENSMSSYMKARPAGQPIVDDWDCFKSMVKTYESYCGSLQTYGRKYMRVFANMCNARIRKDQMAQAAAKVCAI